MERIRINREVAEKLVQAADLLQRQGATTSRHEPYRLAARAI